jgi:hypothetical protein
VSGSMWLWSRFLADPTKVEPTSQTPVQRV